MSLSKEQRLDDDLFYHVQFHEENNKIVPDYGAVLGSFTNLEASEDATRGECYPETEPAMISYSDDIPSLSSASADKTAPTAGKISIIASPTKNSATFSVEGGSDNVGVTYRVVRVYAQSNLQQKVGMDVPVDNSGSVITTNLSPATHYWFQAVFYDAAGNFSGSNVVDLITLGEPPLSRPDKPSNLRIQFREPI